MPLHITMAELKLMVVTVEYQKLHPGQDQVRIIGILIEEMVMMVIEAVVEVAGAAIMAVEEAVMMMNMMIDLKETDTTRIEKIDIDLIDMIEDLEEKIQEIET